VLLFERGISGKIAGQEMRALRSTLPEELPLVCSGRAVNLLAKPIPGVYTAANFGAIVATMRDLGVLAIASGATLDILPRGGGRA
jgi:hypothetical protein